MRILLAEHHSNVMRALHMLIAERTEYNIAAEVSDWDGLLEQARRAKPDLVLLDWGLPGRADHTSFTALQTQDCHPRVIVLSSQSEVKEKALEAGADAFVSKGDAPEKLLDALEVEADHQVGVYADEMVELE